MLRKRRSSPRQCATLHRAVHPVLLLISFRGVVIIALHSQHSLKELVSPLATHGRPAIWTSAWRAMNVDLLARFNEAGWSWFVFLSRCILASLELFPCSESPKIKFKSADDELPPRGLWGADSPKNELTQLPSTQYET